MSGERKDTGRAAEQLADAIGETDAALATDAATQDNSGAAGHEASASGTDGDGDDKDEKRRSGCLTGCVVFLVIYLCLGSIFLLFLRDRIIKWFEDQNKSYIVIVDYAPKSWTTESTGEKQ